jgi:UDP-2,3-diacylglucosamine pyrophosphatase LpxH
MSAKVYRVAFVSDVHAPYEDKQAVDLAEDILQDAKPDLMFFGGDIIDCYSVSDFDRDPKRVINFQEEFDSTIGFLKRFRKLGKEAQYLPGNHEERWERTKNRHPFLASLKDTELANLLKLEQMAIRPLVHGEDHKIGELYYLHGDESGGGGVFPARSLYLKEQGNIIFGHYHKSQVFYNRLKDGTSHGSWANPCLCSLKQEYVKGTTQWQQGLTIISYHGGLFRVDQITFFRTGKDKKLYGCWQDKLYSV